MILIYTYDDLSNFGKGMAFEDITWKHFPDFVKYAYSAKSVIFRDHDGKCKVLKDRYPHITPTNEFLMTIDKNCNIAIR